MALIACRECGAQISDQAVSCPSCGVPTRSTPPKKKSTLSTIIALVAIAGAAFIFIPAMMTNTGDGGAPATPAKRWAPSKDDVAKQPDRKKLMQKFSAFWSKYEGCNTIDLCLYVRPAFYGIEVDQKQTLAQLFWTWHAIEAKSDVVAILLMDARSGKEVGRYERHQLSMN